MPRQARVVAVGVPHHITQRGNNSQVIFLSDEDRRRYQNLLRENLAPCKASLLGWCWMSNHVHLIAIPRRRDSLARLIRRTHSQYAQQFNRRYRRSGHLWESRFFSCPLGSDHLVNALAYVDRNPLRALLVGEAIAYPWSSAGAHVRGTNDEGLLDWSALEQVRGFGASWAERLRMPLDPQTLERLRRSTRSGAAFGSKHFVETLSKRAGRSLDLRPRGRPQTPVSASAAAA